MPQLNVLLVEDSESDAAMMLRQLEKTDYEVCVVRVETADEMQMALAHQPWDLIIADYQLPEFDAPGALAVLQASGQDIPFIVVSGAVGEETAAALMRQGAADFLIKSSLARLGPIVRRELSEAHLRREHRRAQARLLLQAAALNAAANAIVITDRYGAIEWVNPAFTDLTGYEEAEALGKNLRDLVHSGKHDAAFYQHMWETILSGRVWQGELINQRKDYHLYYEEQTITPVYNARGEISQFVAIKQDITRRVQSAQAQQRSHELCRGLIEHLPDALLLARGERVEYANPAALALFCAAPNTGGQLAGRALLELFPAPAQPALQAYLQGLGGAEPPTGLELPILRLDGATQTVSLRGAAYSDSKGAVVQLVLRGG